MMNRSRYLFSAKELALMSNALRILSCDAVTNANSGHPGLPLGMADVVTVLFAHHMNFDPKNPKAPARDRFILSAGHGSALLYSVLHLTGYEKVTIDKIKNFRRHNGMPGHPEYDIAAGIEATTGPLGQGIAMATGMAISNKLEKSNKKIYVLAGDGCLMEGISYEAISLAGHLKLNSIIMLFDDNGITIDGPTSLSVSENHQKKFEAMGWAVFSIDGHDFSQIDQALSAVQNHDKPSVIMCKTKIGYGSAKEASEKAHGSPLSQVELTELRQKLSWPHEERFFIPEEIRKLWKAIISNVDNDGYGEFLDMGGFISSVRENIALFLNSIEKSDQKSEATRKSFERVLNAIPQYMLIGGSADLSPSNNTFGNKMILFGNERDEDHGVYIHYGVREHAMAAIINGIALGGQYIPYGGTFLAFSDYCKAAIRLSAMMKLHVIYVFTHDSIGVGEDGPTHQPIEQLGALRSIPGLNVMRPCDLIETAKCFEIALCDCERPHVLVLSRQNLVQIKRCRDDFDINGYVVALFGDCADRLSVIQIFASGSEVQIGCDVALDLHQRYCFNVEVISIPCLKSSIDWRVSFLDARLRVVIETSNDALWYRFLMMSGFAASDFLICSVGDFGISDTLQNVYAHFHMNVTDVVKRILKKIDHIA